MAHHEPSVDIVALAAWLNDVLEERLSPADLRIESPSGGGWSNDTLFVGADTAECARVVVRLAPTGPAMFPSYDLGRQTAVMTVVRASGRVPVPAILAVDLDGTRVGRPAFVMEFVRGRVPVDDRPSFAEKGFLFDASRAEQRAFHEELLNAVVSVHDCPTPALAAVLAPPEVRRLGVVGQLRQVWEFDRGDRWSPVVDAALDRLGDGEPRVGDRDVLLWGDARPANVIVPDTGFAPVALLDWELASVGPPEFDITWLAEMNRMRMQGSGVAPLPGFLPDDEAVAHYEARSGRRLRDLPWFRLFSAARIAVLMHRHLRVMVHVGRLPADHRLMTRTIAIDRLEELLS
jgi:aminoglycoside phosphotransferase (APT) family kinase protein